MLADKDREYSVSEISLNIKKLLNNNFNNVKIRGEISGYKGQYGSGHVYFALKEKDAKIDVIIWKSVFANLKIKPEEGLEVIATGNISAYAPSSKYNLTVTSLEPAGVGSLMALFEKLKKQLSKEGLFDVKYKKPLPVLPKKIGIITSAKGAVIRDIEHRLNERLGCHIMVWDVLVQGSKSANDIAMAIKGFNALDKANKPDLLIVARGGGSIEDLWSFNEEPVIRAAFASDIPLISAVGHETDFTLLDLVADFRAPTPTAAAEIILPLKKELQNKIIEKTKRLNLAIARKLDSQQDKYKALIRAMPTLEYVFINFWRSIDEKAQKLIYNIERIFLQKHNKFEKNKNRQFIQTILERKTEQLNSLIRLLNSVSYNKVLERGFALLLSKEGIPISNAKDIGTNEELILKMHDGSAIIEAKTTKVIK